MVETMGQRAMRTARAITLLFSPFFISALAHAQSEAGETGLPPEFPPNVGILEQTIAVPFEPVSLYALQEVGLGEIRQYRAVAAQLSTPAEAEQTKSFQLIVGAPVARAKDQDEDGIFHFTFFLTDLNGQFAATEVKGWSWKRLVENTLPGSLLERNGAAYAQEIEMQQTKNVEMEKQLTSMREQASKIAEVDEIIDLKSELTNVRGFDEQKSAEIARLKALVAAGRDEPDPPNLVSIRATLAENLAGIAKVTALADRLSGRRRDAAAASYRRKINMVRETEGIDAELLAQEALDLRRRRKELESRLSKGGAAAEAEANSEF